MTNHAAQAQILELIGVLNEHDIAPELDLQTGELSLIECQGCVSVVISKRPHYCDRGQWLLHVESLDPTRLTIDHSDRFPRYYFHSLCLAMELRAWLNSRSKGLRS